MKKLVILFLVIMALCANNAYAGVYDVADFDWDNDVDLVDFGFFQAVFNGPYKPFHVFYAPYSQADFDNDINVDSDDLGTFMNAFNGSTNDLRADFDWDQDVDLTDLAFFNAVFNGPVYPYHTFHAPFSQADFDIDGDTDLGDFATFTKHFTGPVKAAPEPVSSALFLLGGAVLGIKKLKKRS